MSFDVALRFMVQGAGASAAEIDRVDKALDRSAQSAKGAAGQFGELKGALAALAGGLTAAALLEMADAATTLGNRLRLATGSATVAAEVYERLYGIAQQSRTSFTELGGTYATLARAGAQLGVSQTRLLTVTEAIGNAMAIGGGSAAGMQAALVQLGQGMAAGVLRGEELNSILEQAPRLAQALADGLGVPIGALRRLGEEGQLTAERVMAALESAAPQLAREVGQATMTVSQGFQVLQNSLLKFVGEADRATGASTALAKAMQQLAGAIDATGNFIREHETAFAVLGGALAGAAVVGGVAALAGALGLVKAALVGLAAVLSPPVLAVLGIGAAVGGGLAAYNAYAKTADGIRDTIEALRQANELSEQALERAAGRPAAQANIRAAMQERLDQIRQLEAALAQLSGQGLDTRAEDARLARSTAAYAEQQAVLANLAAVKARLYGQDEQRVATLQQLAAARNADALSLQEYVALVAKANSQTESGKEATKALERQRELLVQLSGYSQDYEQRVRDLVALRQAGLVTEERYVQEVQALVAKQPAVAENLRRENELLAARNKLLQAAQDEAQDYLDAQLATLGRDAEAAERALAAARDEYSQYGLLRSQVAALTLQRLRDKQTAYEAGTAEYATIQRQIDAQQELIAVLQRGELRERNAAAARDAAAQWQRAADDIERALTDALMRGFESGRGFAQSLRDSISNTLRTTVVRVAVQPVMGAVRGLFGMPGVDGGPAGAGGGGGSPLGSLASLGSTLSGFSDLSRAGGAAAANGNSWGALQAGWNMMKGGQLASGATFSAGAVLPQLGTAAALWSLARGIQDGYKLGGLSNDMSTLIGGGVVARLFGRRARETRGSGITGAVSAEGFDGQAYTDWFRKGGVFRSDKSGRDFATVGAELDQTIDASIGMLYGSTEAYAKALGLPVEAARRFTGQFSVAWGQSEAENEKALQAALDKLREDLAGVYGASLAPLQRAGETLAQTMERLATLQTFSAELAKLGGVFGRVAALGVDAREAIINLAGGMDALRSKATAFAQDYYSRDEIAGIRAREVQANLAAVGITQDVASKAEYRALVEATDVSTEQGQRQLVALLDAAPVFSEIADYLAELGSGSLASTASQAPAQGTVAGLFAQGDTAQVNAINAVRDSIDTMADRLVQAIQGQGQWVTVGNGDGESTFWQPTEVWQPNASDGP